MWLMISLVKDSDSFFVICHEKDKHELVHWFILNPGIGQGVNVEYELLVL